MQALHDPLAMAARAAVASGKAMRELRWLTWFPIGLMVGLLLISVLLPDLARAVMLPVAVTGALIGIPHGAVDHVLPAWWSVAPAGDRSRSRRAAAARMGIFALVYAALATLALAAFLLLPTPTLMVFLVVSAAHFGRGEVVTSAERAGRSVPTALADWPVSLAHGLSVVGLLLWARPESTGRYLRPLSAPLADVATATRGPGLLLVTLAVAGGALVLLTSGRSLELAELLLVAGTFALAPPLAAFGIYFGGWHAVRHTARLLDLARGTLPTCSSAPAGGSSWGPAATRLGRSAALPTLGALVAVGMLWKARDLAGIQAEIGVLLALTFPHAAVVLALDRRAASARIDALAPHAMREV